MRVIVCGSRDWIDVLSIFERIKALPKDAIIIQGGAEGTDAFALQAAKRLELKHETFPADWTTYGHSAGPIRNQQMLDSGCDLILAFRKNKSRGTSDMIERARKAKVPVEIVDIE